ncbi:ankyrin repeat-containing protein BDA1 [Eucalyptus grandis]|uniref:ankyrin repeat-containing protein BDA1 n=1 Tax=Eucalyptus grandis TaxID=71139 RepID=UPI00192EBBD4|nr:ankyrin repeat-containing protein BDA1 [Eucalyptus grandis]
MESKLYEAIVEGNVHSLLALLSKDMLLLDRTMVGNQTESPLHIAAMLGHLGFVEEVLAWKVEMAKEQNSQGSTPLHLAVAKCAAWDILENGQTIMHIFVKNNKLEVLKLLVDILDDEQFINSKDEDGNTILYRLLLLIDKPRYVHTMTLEQQILIRIAIFTTWVAVIFMEGALSMQILVLTEDDEGYFTYDTVETAMEVRAVLMILIFGCHLFVPILKWLPGVLKSVFKVLKFISKALKKQKREYLTI